MIDLHLHTTASDGTLSPADLVARAERAGLTTISVTDHDTVAGLADASAHARRRGLRFIDGIEITAVEDERDTHVLGYFFDPADVAHPTRRNVCPMPRGIAYDASTDAIHVACRGGELVTLPAAGGAATRTVRLDRDLRDVIVSGDHLHVTRFRSAELLVVDRASGRLTSRLRA